MVLKNVEILCSPELIIIYLYNAVIVNISMAISIAYNG